MTNGGAFDGDEAPLISVVQASQRSIAASFGPRGSVLCSSCFFLTLLSGFVLSMAFFSTRGNGFDLLKATLSPQWACPLTNEDSVVALSSAQTNKSEKGNTTLSLKEAKEALPLQTKDNGTEKGVISCEQANTRTNTSSTIISVRSTNGGKGNSTVSHEEARELLGGWYIPPDLDIMAGERKGGGGGSGASGAEEVGRDGGKQPNPDRDVCEFCGPWMREYAEFHRNARRVGNKGTDPKQRVKYITFTCKNGGPRCISGLGDDFVGMASTFMMALVTNRVVLIDWDLNYGTEFEPAGVDWRVDPGLALGWEGNPGVGAELFTKKGEEWVREEVEMRKEGSTWLSTKRKVVGKSEGDMVHVGNGSESGGKLEGEAKPWVILEVNTVNLDVHDTQLSVRNAEVAWRDVDHVVMRTNRGIVTHTLLRSDEETSNKLIKERGMRPPVAFGCILRLLLRVKPAALEEVAPLMRPLQGHSLCIHVRVEDDASGFIGNPKTRESQTQTDALMHNAKPLFQCAEALSAFWFAQTASFKWLFMSSSFTLKKAAKKFYGDKVVTTHFHPRHITRQSSSKETYRAVVGEWALLTTCDKFIVTESGFSKTSVMYSLKPQSTWLFQRWRNYSNTSPCLVQYPTDMIRLGTEWSGL